MQPKIDVYHENSNYLSVRVFHHLYALVHHLYALVRIGLRNKFGHVYFWTSLSEINKCPNFVEIFIKTKVELYMQNIFCTYLFG